MATTYDISNSLNEYKISSCKFTHEHINGIIILNCEIVETT